MRLLLVTLFCACWSWTNTFAIAQDSVGTETVDGQVYIIHQVTGSETLYSLSRKYELPIYKIIEHNPPTEYGLDEGQTVRIPILVKEKSSTTKPVAIIPVKKEPEIEAESQINKEPIENEVTLNGVSKNLNHEVKQKETLFSISRLYDVSVEDIKVWNDLTSNSLDIGQQLIIKQGEADAPEASQAITGKSHVVKPSETLYSISRLYNLPVSELKEWNNLTTNELSIGQSLLVEAPRIIKSTPQVNVIVSESTVAPEDTVVVKAVLDTARYNIQPKERSNFEEVIETGLAEQIEGSANNRKYLALHKTAKTGTIMRVKNEMNSQEIFVRIIGPLPDTSDNKNLIIKISRAAYDRLGAIDPKFRVRVSYIP